MNMLQTHSLAVAAISVVSLSALASLPGHDKREFTDEFSCPSGAYINSGGVNQYFPLNVGTVAYLNNQACVDEGECDELEEVTITVTPNTELVDGVLARVVEELELEGGEVVETSLNYYAECDGTGDVFYFGETVVDGDNNPLPDGWLAGENGARAGIIMPGGSFLLGARYFQEVAPGVALDRGEHVGMGLSFPNPNDGPDFENCVLVSDTNFLSDPKGKESDEKVYCPGVGLVMDEELELVTFSP
ncbi:hypothetical protein FV139_06810 [Parahaliea maris]|uniref:Uncharacterized protein n=1 Tax=Parahaliea maris TaxID=2716870 RepID=A0A5C9A3X4_9GAMM|nr:hypothetical protein [Parahaliea maris]TXS95585.1 hypothetical protein FV139_06810 [Parahaliea maris]